MTFSGLRKLLISATVLLLVICSCFTSFAADERVYFGEDEYEIIDLDDNTSVGIHAYADNGMYDATLTLKYDPYYLRIDERTSPRASSTTNNTVTYTGTNLRIDEWINTISFMPLVSGETELTLSGSIVNDLRDTVVPGASRVRVSIPFDDGGRLESLKINGDTIDGFSPDKTIYKISIPENTRQLDIEAEAEDADVNVIGNEKGNISDIVRIETKTANGMLGCYEIQINKTAAVASLDTDEDSEDQVGFKEFLGKHWMSILTLLDLILLTLIIKKLIKSFKLRKARRERYLKEAELIRRRQQNDKYKKDENTNEDLVVKVSHVVMDFIREMDESTSIKEAVIKAVKGERKKVKFRALNDITFDVYRGEVVGIIGTNGSGKSTMVKIISGALSPTMGSVEVDHDKVQLLTLGTGFDMELTGRENIYLNGAIIGYSREFIDEHFDSIVKFAELEDFMDEKVRNYSSGMVQRLGFAIATARDAAQILILDEVFAVGDQFFRKKSERRIKELIHSGSTAIIVSHSMDIIKKNCDRVVWIEKGHLKMTGKPDEVCDKYSKMSMTK